MSNGAQKRRRRSGRPLWLVEGLDIVEQRRGPLLGAVGLVVVIPLLLAIFAPSIVPPTPLVGAAVALAALLLGLAAALAVDTTDLIVRGPRHVGAAGGELVALLPDEANPGSVRALAASVLEAREPGTQLLLGIAGAGREAAETAGWTEALGMALVRSGVSVLRIDLASGRTESPGLTEVSQGEHRLTEVVEIEPGRKLARLGAGRDQIRALRSLPSLPGRLPADLDVLLVALPSATNREVVNASRALDHMLVMAHRDSTSRVQLIAALDALGSTGATAQVVLVDDRTVTRLGPGASLAGTSIAEGTSRPEPSEPEPSEPETAVPETAQAQDQGAAQVDGDPPSPGIAGVTGVGGGAVVAAQLARRMPRPEPTPDPEVDDEPAAETAEGAADDAEPAAVVDAEPVVAEPAAESAEPVVDDAAPVADDAAPVVDDAEPAAESAEPVVDDAEPWADLPPPQMPSDRPGVAADTDDGPSDSSGVATGPGLPPSVAPAPGPFGDWVARQAARDDAARKAAREEAARADAARAAREDAAREEAAREEEAREAAAREEAARQAAARDAAAHAPGRDSEAEHEEPPASEPRDVDVLLGAAEAAALAITDMRSEGPLEPPAVQPTTLDDRGAVDPVPASVAPAAADLVPPPAPTEPPRDDETAGDDDPTGDDGPTGAAAADDEDTDELPAVRRPEPIRPAESEQDDLLRTTAQLAVLMDDLDVRTDDRP